MSLKPHVKQGKVILTEGKPHYMPKAYLKTRKLTYTDCGRARFIQSTIYVLKSKTIDGLSKQPHIGLMLQMGNTNKIAIQAQEFEGLVLAFEELAIDMRQQLEKVQSAMDKQVAEFFTP